MLDTTPLLTPTDFPPIKRDRVGVLQVNLGYLCNLSCTHCHVNAGPKRTEIMALKTIEQVEQLLQAETITQIDITGGAPEMNPHFKRLVRHATDLGIEVIDRCNLTILEQRGYEDFAEFLAKQGVTIIASLPCYSADNVRQQRGDGVFESSIRVLQNLNQLGYGKDDPKLQLHLVYNPNGFFLPPLQSELERTYKQILHDNFNIQFNQLFALANMPINRYGAQLLAKGQYQPYMQLLKDNYSEANLEQLMCKNTISIDWQGYVYDCDFNQMLEMTMTTEDFITSNKRLHISYIIDRGISWLEGRSISTGEHCYGCTAGQGSSCGGAL